MTDKCTIYIVTNSTNEKVYIGQTWQKLYQRFNEHACNAKHVSKLTNAMNKHGKENFTITALVTADNQLTADYLEKFWITTYDSIKTGYNIKEGGSHGRTSKETKQKLSMATKNWLKTHSPQFQGCKHSDETKKRMSESAKKRWSKK